MAVWNLAVAWTSGGYTPDPYAFPQATVQRIPVEGGWTGVQGYGSFAEALLDLMREGYEPFSAHRWEDFDAYGLHPVKTTGSLPIRDYVWFRREVKSSTARQRPVTEAQSTRSRP